MTVIPDAPVAAFDPADAGSALWHEQRAAGVGGSEIAAVLDLSPYTSRFALWHYKADRLPPIVLDNELLTWGRIMEGPIRDRFAALHASDGQIVQTPMWQRTDRPYQIYSPDGLLIDDRGPVAILECKNTRDDIGWGELARDEVPMHYRTQVMWGMDALQIDRAVIAVLISGSDYREYAIRYDEADAALLRDAAAEFMDSVQAGRRPAIDDHAATYETVRRLHPDIDRGVHQLDADLAIEYVQARYRFADAEAAMRLATSRVADAMGDARQARFNGSTIATRQRRSEDGLPFLVAGRKLPYLTKAA